MFPMSFLTLATTIMLQLTTRAQHQRFPATYAAFCRCHGHAVLKWQWASQALPNRNGYNIHGTFFNWTTMDETSNTTSMDHIAQAYLHNAPGMPIPIQFPPYFLQHALGRPIPIQGRMRNPTGETKWTISNTYNDT